MPYTLTSREGALDSQDVVVAVARAFDAVGSVGEVVPAVDRVSCDLVRVLHAVKALADGGAGDGVVAGHPGGVVAQGLVSLGQALEGALEHHLPVDGDD